MLSSFSLKRIAQVAATGTILTFAHFSAAQAAICYQGTPGVKGSSIIAGGNKSAVTKGNAQKKARSAWNGKAQSLMGSSRANWGNAQSRYYYCHHSFVWHCTAYARPCM